MVNCRQVQRVLCQERERQHGGTENARLDSRSKYSQLCPLPSFRHHALIWILTALYYSTLKRSTEETTDESDPGTVSHTSQEPITDRSSVERLTLRRALTRGQLLRTNATYISPVEFSALRTHLSEAYTAGTYLKTPLPAEGSPAPAAPNPLTDPGGMVSLYILQRDSAKTDLCLMELGRNTRHDQEASSVRFPPYAIIQCILTPRVICYSVDSYLKFALIRLEIVESKC